MREENESALNVAWLFYLKKKSNFKFNVLSLFVIRERHCGGIAPGFHVIHRNGVTVDNRLENLALVAIGSPAGQLLASGGRRQNSTQQQRSSSVLGHNDYQQCEDSGHTREHSLYWAAIQQLPADPVEEVSVTLDAAAVTNVNVCFFLATAFRRVGCHKVLQCQRRSHWRWRRHLLLLWMSLSALHQHGTRIERILHLRPMSSEFRVSSHRSRQVSNSPLSFRKPDTVALTVSKKIGPFTRNPVGSAKDLTFWNDRQSARATNSNKFRPRKKTCFKKNL